MLRLQHIWQKVLKGDANAQRKLYQMTSAEIMNICRRYLSKQEFCQDAFQETYIKVFTKSAHYNSKKGTLSAWMAKVAVNECLQILRKQKKLVLLDVISDVHSPTTDEDVISDLSAEEIYAEVARLADGYRTIFNLYVVEGYNHNEIGEMLGISPVSSRSQLSRAKLILKEAIRKKTKTVSYEAAQ